MGEFQGKTFEEIRQEVKEMGQLARDYVSRQTGHVFGVDSREDARVLDHFWTTHPDEAALFVVVGETLG